MVVGGRLRCVQGLRQRLQHRGAQALQVGQVGRLGREGLQQLAQPQQGVQAGLRVHMTGQPRPAFGPVAGVGQRLCQFGRVLGPPAPGAVALGRGLGGRLAVACDAQGQALRQQLVEQRGGQAGGLAGLHEHGQLPGPRGPLFGLALAPKVAILRPGLQQGRAPGAATGLHHAGQGRDIVGLQLGPVKTFAQLQRQGAVGQGGGQLGVAGPQVPGALVMAAVNIFGGFLVTNRMLAMYKKKS